MDAVRRFEGSAYQSRCRKRWKNFEQLSAGRPILLSKIASERQHGHVRVAYAAATWLANPYTRHRGAVWSDRATRHGAWSANDGGCRCDDSPRFGIQNRQRRSPHARPLLPGEILRGVSGGYL